MIRVVMLEFIKITSHIRTRVRSFLNPNVNQIEIRYDIKFPKLDTSTAERFMSFQIIKSTADSLLRASLRLVCCFSCIHI